MSAQQSHLDAKLFSTTYIKTVKGLVEDLTCETPNVSQCIDATSTLHCSLQQSLPVDHVDESVRSTALACFLA